MLAAARAQNLSQRTDECPKVLAPRLDRAGEVGEVVGRRAGAKAHDQAVPTDLVQREDPVGEVHRVVEGCLDHRRADFHVGRRRCRDTQGDERVGQHEAAPQGLGRPEAVEAFVRIGPCLLGEDAPRRVPGHWAEEGAESHGAGFAMSNGPLAPDPRRSRESRPLTQPRVLLER